jgi:hypothetical protein
LDTDALNYESAQRNGNKKESMYGDARMPGPCIQRSNECLNVPWINARQGRVAFSQRHLFTQSNVRQRTDWRRAPSQNGFTLKSRRNQKQGNDMNHQAWIGIIIWGIFVTGFGLNTATSGGTQYQSQDVVFLIAGGMLSCLIGMIGLIGFMGWIPGLRNTQNNSTQCTSAYRNSANN